MPLQEQCQRPLIYLQIKNNLGYLPADNNYNNRRIIIIAFAFLSKMGLLIEIATNTIFLTAPFTQYSITY